MAELQAPLRNPYPGLRPFRTGEEHLFFGRERQVDRMIAKLAAQHFLAVVGTSGSGKSSLVNCGLRPALHRGYMAQAGANWRMAQFRPGSDPIGAMARALAATGVLYETPLDGAVSEQTLAETTLRLGSLGLVTLVDQAGLPPGTQLLVVADQFEELFRVGAQGGEFGASADAVAFVQLLLAAAAQRDVPIHVVLTMRSDFLGECAQFNGLPEAINESQYLVPRLTRDQIRAAITGPAGVRGVELGAVLVTQLLNDVGDNPDQLSILQHALNRTWAHWENEGGGRGKLELPDYNAIGTMADALNRHADKAYGELPEDAHSLCQKVFKALTDTGTDARGVRRMTQLKALGDITGATPAQLEAVLKVFRKGSRSFLMPPEGEPLGPDSDIDISHESLMRVWKKLQAWGVEEAQSAQALKRLADSAKGYPENEGLWRDPKLQLALNWERKQQPNAAWARLYGVELAPALQFLRASETARAEEVAADAKARADAAAATKALADAEARRARKRRLIVWGSAGGSVFAGLIIVLIFTLMKGRQEAAKVQELTRINQEKNVTSELFKMLQMATGPDPGAQESAMVPELRGQPQAAAQKTLESLQLGTEVSEVIHFRPPDTVLDQFPRPPSRVALGERVYLVVAMTEAAAKAKEKKAAADAAASSVAMQKAAAAPAPAPPAPPPSVAAAAQAAAAPAPETPPEVTTAVPAAAPTGPAGTDPANTASACAAGPWSPWLSNAQFQASASSQKGAGNYPARIQGKLDGYDLKFRAVFAPKPKSGDFYWDIYRSTADRSTLEKVRGNKGLTKVCEHSFSDTKGEQRWQITWVTKTKTP